MFNRTVEEDFKLLESTIRSGKANFNYIERLTLSLNSTLELLKDDLHVWVANVTDLSKRQSYINSYNNYIFMVNHYSFANYDVLKYEIIKLHNDLQKTLSEQREKGVYND